MRSNVFVERTTPIIKQPLGFSSIAGRWRRPSKNRVSLKIPYSMNNYTAAYLLVFTSCGPMFSARIQRNHGEIIRWQTLLAET